MSESVFEKYNISIELKLKVRDTGEFLDKDGIPSKEGFLFPDMLMAHEAASKFCLTHSASEKVDILWKDGGEFHFGGYI